MNATKPQLRIQLWFYLGIPILIGFFLGWIQVGRTAEWPKTFSLLYWFGVSMGSLYLLELLTPPFARVLRPRGAPLWLTLVVAQVVIGYVAILPVMRLFTQFVQSFLPAAMASPLQSASMASAIQKLPSNIIAWVSVNLLFFYLLGFARFGYEPPQRQLAQNNTDDNPSHDTGQTTSAKGELSANIDQPVFLSQVRDDRQGELLALRAEGHYLCVYTDVGSDLVSYSLSDALAELPATIGMRVHRSWWVAEKAIASASGSDALTLVNGLKVPVSRSYRVQAKERGWLN